MRSGNRAEQLPPGLPEGVLVLKQEQQSAITSLIVMRFEGLVGHVMEKVEMMGLKDGQERAAKSSIKNDIWSFYNHICEDLFDHVDPVERAKLDKLIHEEGIAARQSLKDFGEPLDSDSGQRE
jgi:hypothetical protein